MAGESLMYCPASAFTPTDTAGAQFTTRNELVCLAFATGADEFARIGLWLPTVYGAGGVDIAIAWMTVTVDGGTDGVFWTTQFKSITSDADDFDSATFATGQGILSDPASVSGEFLYPETQHDNGAEMDSVAIGEWFQLQIFRDVSNAGDTLNEDALFVGLEIRNQ